MGTFGDARTTLRWRAVGPTVLLAVVGAVASAGDGRSGPPAAMAQPRAADAGPSVLRPVAHAGGRFNGLAVDGDAVYIGEGSDVVTLRTDAVGQVSVVRRTPLPEVVTSVAIAAEVDRLYVAAGDAVYALSIADRMRPAVVDGVTVPLETGGNIVARGHIVYARLFLPKAGQERCVAAVSFGGTPETGAVGPAACATDIGDAIPSSDRLTLGDGVLAAHKHPYSFSSMPALSLFDVSVPAQPRFKRSMAFDDEVMDAALIGKRLWVTAEHGMSARSYDVSNLDVNPDWVAEAALPFRNPIDRLFASAGEIWLMTVTSLSAFDPNATGKPQPTKVRWVYGCEPQSSLTAWTMAIARDAVLSLDTGRLSVCRMPPDDRHIVHDSMSTYTVMGSVNEVTAAGGRSYTLGSVPSMLYPFVHSWPTALVRLDPVRPPPIARGSLTRYPGFTLIDADPHHLVLVQAERLASIRVPFVGDPVLAAAWTIPPAASEAEGQATAVRVAADRAAFLRPSDLHVVDLARPDVPAVRIAERWRFGRALAVGAGWAAVLAGGYDSSSRSWSPPHVVLVDLRSWPPAVLGELTLADRGGWDPVGIAAVGDRLVVGLTQPVRPNSRGPVSYASEIVVVDAADPAAPFVAGQVAIEEDGGTQLQAIAAADGLVIVGGRALRAPDPEALPEWGALQPRGRLWVVDISEPAQPVLRQAIDVPGSPVEIAVDGRAVLVAAEEGGLLRLDLVPPDWVPPPAWHLVLPWLGVGERPVRGQPIPRRATTAP